ncbi:helix-turn-helix domain-containing protein [Salipiger sp. HF18]|uniref:helix-turn-helix domain-containing protein n=1 Tax=Salipiger sp. HF18 TaxID=2721557 RepID=UPI0020CB1EB0|nr:helix-turn-helix domain-containing protein [Salipiger sp. HF18]
MRQIPYLAGKQGERTNAHEELDLRERRRIEDLLNAKLPVSRIAAEIGRHRSTVYREIRRNWFSYECLPGYDGYYGGAAHQKATSRRARQRKLIRHPELRNQVVERIRNGWTPEQIANRLIHEGATLRVCQETIYRYIYSKEGMAQELWWYLPEHPRPAGLQNSTVMSISCSARIPPGQRRTPQRTRPLGG